MSLEEKNTVFDDIRPYYDSEIHQACLQLLKDPEIKQWIPKALPGYTADSLKNILREVHSIEQFKVKISLPYLKHLVENTCFSLSTSGMSQLTSGEPYLFISNHRDIILDASLLSVMLHQRDQLFPRIAIGDNLLITESIKKLVRINNSFIVKRSPDIRQKLVESRKLSAYIAQSIQQEKASVWIAQREGRAKNSDDRTQTAMLKMLCMGSSLEPVEALKRLRIVPVSISYEYDPCDYLKAKEMLEKHLNPDFKKTAEDDYLNMKTGLQGYKGRVHFAIAKPLEEEFWNKVKTLSRGSLLEAVAAQIDQRIHCKYRLYPVNYMAVDLLKGIERHSAMYSHSELEKFQEYISTAIMKSAVAQEHQDFLRDRLLEMYANPLLNHLSALEKEESL